jgi:hypothetical protein
VKDFLIQALRQRVAVNINLVTGVTFESLTVVDVDEGVVAVTSGPKKKPYVIALTHIVWAALA